jgi:hypothetical protein
MNKILGTLRNKPEILVYIYFFVVTVFFALRIKLGVAPDEHHHYDLIRYYANNSLDPFLDKQNSDFALGSINSSVSYLYHYLMSYAFRLSDLINIDTVFGVRFVNILLGIGTLISLNYIGAALKLAKRTRIAILILIANIPMFMFLSASINYDNLVIFMTVLAVAITLGLQKKFTVQKMTALIAIILLGPVVKKAFLAISAALFVYAAYLIYMNRSQIRKQTESLYKKEKIKLALLGIVLLVSLSAPLIKYGTNMVHYGTLEPKCTAVLSDEQCLNYPIYARTKNYNSHPVTINPMSKDKYVVSWLDLMVERTYGLFGHKTFQSSAAVLTLVVMMAYVLIILFFRKVSIKSLKSTIIPALFFFYMAALIYTNHKSYVRRGNIGLAVQGRYAFPVLLPFIIYVVSLYNRTLSKKLFQNVLLALVIIFALITGPLYILKGIDPSWLNNGLLI